MIAVIEDVTERREIESRLERSHALQRVAGRIGRVGGWSADLERDEVFWSPEIYNILEWDGEEAPPLSDRWRCACRRIVGALKTPCKRCAEDGVPFDLELEITSFGGRKLQVRAAGERERDSGPRSTRNRRVPGYFRAQAARGPAP